MRTRRARIFRQAQSTLRAVSSDDFSVRSAGRFKCGASREPALPVCAGNAPALRIHRRPALLSSGRRSTVFVSKSSPRALLVAPACRASDARRPEVPLEHNGPLRVRGRRRAPRHRSSTQRRVQRTRGHSERHCDRPATSSECPGKPPVAARRVAPTHNLRFPRGSGKVRKSPLVGTAVFVVGAVFGLGLVDALILDVLMPSLSLSGSGQPSSSL